MTIPNLLGRRAVLLITLLVTALAGAVLPSGARVDAAVPHTRLVVNVDGCNRCTVTLVRAISDTSISWHSRAQRVGADGQVVFDVPTRRTHGMSFEVRAPWESAAVDSVLNVATRYKKQAVGEAWTTRRAKHSRVAYGCWAGTQRAQVTLDVRVARFHFQSGTIGKQRAALAWATTGLRSWQPTAATFHGRIGNQDAFYCTRP